MGASPDKGFSGGGAQGRDVEKAAHAAADQETIQIEEKPYPRHAPSSSSNSCTAIPPNAAGSQDSICLLQEIHGRFSCAAALGRLISAGMTHRKGLCHNPQRPFPGSIFSDRNLYSILREPRLRESGVSIIRRKTWQGAEAAVPAFNLFLWI